MQMNMSDTSRRFLEKYLPQVFEMDDFVEVLLALDAFITANGFDMDDEITLFGREGEAVYDDLYWNNEW